MKAGKNFTLFFMFCQPINQLLHGDAGPQHERQFQLLQTLIVQSFFYNIFSSPDSVTGSYLSDGLTA
jgi:hypothetical protein